MAIVTGCRFGIVQRGGFPRQCGRQQTYTLNVQASDRPAKESMAVCTEHYALLNSRREGTLYREDANGLPVATRVKL